MNIGATEILFILLVVLVLFGGKRLPDLARTIGRGLAEVRRATQEIQREITSPPDELPPSVRSPSAEPASSSEQTDPSSIHAHPTAQPGASEKPPRSDS
jgi:sec-independent protein translocase protein TatA